MATSERTPIAKNSFKCPICGAWDADGGCPDVRECIEAFSRMGMEHRREAVEVLAQRSRSNAARVAEVGFDALSLLHIGLVVCGRAGEVLGANQTAEEILGTRDGLEQSADGILCATEEGSQPLGEIVEQVAAGTYSGRFGGDSVVLSVRRGGRRRPLTVVLRANHAAVTEPTATDGAVLVMILDSALPVRTIESELRQLYGFTSTEARLANILMEGKDLEDCCQELGIGRSTGCTHLRRIFKKTGVHRQSELVALLLKGIGLACLGNLKTKAESQGKSVRLEAQERKGSRIDPSGVVNAQ
jgi:DNA-binding CsgD family transcriptional regulator